MNHKPRAGCARRASVKHRRCTPGCSKDNIGTAQRSTTILHHDGGNTVQFSREPLSRFANPRVYDANLFHIARCP